jgi:hypothetical protein
MTLRMTIGPRGQLVTRPCDIPAAGSSGDPAIMSYDACERAAGHWCDSEQGRGYSGGRERRACWPRTTAGPDAAHCHANALSCPCRSKPAPSPPGKVHPTRSRSGSRRQPLAPHGGTPARGTGAWLALWDASDRHRKTAIDKATSHARPSGQSGATTPWRSRWLPIPLAPPAGGRPWSAACLP